MSVFNTGAEKNRRVPDLSGFFRGVRAPITAFAALSLAGCADIAPVSEWGNTGGTPAAFCGGMRTSQGYFNCMDRETAPASTFNVEPRVSSLYGTQQESEHIAEEAYTNREDKIHRECASGSIEASGQYLQCTIDGRIVTIDGPAQN